MLKKLEKIVKSVGQVVKSTDNILKVFTLVILLIAVAVYVCLFKDEISDKQLAVVMAGFVIIVVLCFLLSFLAGKKIYILHMNYKILQKIMNSEHGLMDLVTDDIRDVPKEPDKKKLTLMMKRKGEIAKDRNVQIPLPLLNKDKSAEAK
ncbi:MAG: hypothetical protein ACOYVF_06080 [Candidatus Zixiibacteriota bacterium]